MVRVRFAPSPTGHLHIGGARTALFNWLFARHHKGRFILRIEDTDLKRSNEENTKEILDGLLWLGLNWDEGPYSQSKRLFIYQEYAERLIKERKAYLCYCTKEELIKRRQSLLKEKKDPVYDGTCLRLSEEGKKRFRDEGRPYTIRFKTPKGFTIMEDIVRGRREFDNALIGDFILIKSDGHPAYNFACVVDDATMQISHVIRGDDHISNTPRQLLLYEALGFKAPQFVHLPMIWGPDRTRLSKRHGATSINEYKKEGYLPEAIINYLALLGWGTYDSQQIFNLQEMIDKFSLDRISKTPAIFDPKKLLWMNGQYIMKLNTEEFITHSKPYLKGYEVNKRGEGWLRRLASLYKTRLKTFGEFANKIGFFFEEEIHPDEGAKRILSKDKLYILEMLKNRLILIDSFDIRVLEREIRALAKEECLDPKDLIHPLRAAITGREVSPPIFDTMVLLGKELVISRLEKIICKLRDNSL